jgi:hypothetical protein
MKKATIIGTLLLATLTFSCKKYEGKEWHYDKDGGEVELGEKCGDDIGILEADGYTENGVTYTVHCGEDH